MDAGDLEVKDFAAGEDLPSRCPALMYEPVALAPRSELDRRAAQLVQAAPPVAAPAAAPASAPAPTAPVSPQPAPRKPPPKAQ
jgi:hypothetical protein